jgi:hypothetical protein
MCRCFSLVLLGWCLPKVNFNASVEFQLIQLITGSLHPVLGWILLGCLSKVKSNTFY